MKLILTNLNNFEKEVELTSYFCPNCSGTFIVEEIRDGDYYQGSLLHCTICKFSFTMPSRGIDKSIILKI